jgi:hypothetical protein
MTAEQFKKDVKARIRAIETKPNAGVGVLCSHLRRQLDEHAPQLEGLVQSLRKLLLDFDKNFEEFRKELK